MQADKLPKLYRTVNLKFWSLKNELGGSGGVIFDCDTQVTRKCRRVICPDGWKWQVCKNFIGDWTVEYDQECLDEQGMDLWGLEWH